VTGIAVEPADACVVALRKLEQISEELPQVDRTTFTGRGRRAAGAAATT